MEKIKRQIFYSFHFDNDVFRVQQIRNMGTIEGNEPVSKNAWEEVKTKGDTATANWIDNNMKYRSCVIVLVGSQTAGRKWIDYEIKKAWDDGKGLFGIYIHNLRDPRYANDFPFYGKSLQGANPFDGFTFSNTGEKLSSRVRCYNPDSNDTYNDIKNNLEVWVDRAIKDRE